MGAQAPRLRPVETDPLLAADLARVRREAATYQTAAVWNQDMTVHNAHLLRARLMQRRVLTPLAHWTIDDDPRSRRATLAWAWDWLQPTLTPAERAMLLAIARRWPVAAFRATDRAGKNWWFGKPDCNWNTVCAGGPGMLALALGDALPESKALLARVETSIAPYFRPSGWNREGGVFFSMRVRAGRMGRICQRLETPWPAWFRHENRGKSLWNPIYYRWSAGNPKWTPTRNPNRMDDGAWSVATTSDHGAPAIGVEHDQGA